MGYKIGAVVIGGFNPPEAFNDEDYAGNVDLTLDRFVEPSVIGVRVQHTNSGHVTQPQGVRAKRLSFGGSLPGHVEYRSQLGQLVSYHENETIVEVSRLFATPSATYNEEFIGRFYVERLRRERVLWRAGQPDLVRWSCTLVEASLPLPAGATVARA